MAHKEARYVLSQDKTGMWWDLALYVPTVIFLLSIGFQLWYTTDKDWTYLLIFLATFFFLVGFNRIFKTRLMLLPGSPVAIDASKKQVTLELRNGEKVELVKGVRYYPDFAGKSFAITGLDLAGKKLQHVFHRGQFSDEKDYKDLREFLRVFG